MPFDDWFRPGEPCSLIPPSGEGLAGERSLNLVSLSPTGRKQPAADLEQTEMFRPLDSVGWRAKVFAEHIYCDIRVILGIKGFDLSCIID